MSKLLKLLKALKLQGWASIDQKSQVQTLYKELDPEDQEAVAEDVEEAEALAETDPEAADDTEGDTTTDEELEKSIKKLVKSVFKSEAVDLRADMEVAVKKFFAEQKELMEKKAGVFHEEIKSNRGALNQTLRKTLQASLLDEKGELQKLAGAVSQKELTTDAQGSPYGGYAVDRELSAEIRAMITEYGVARREFTAVQLTKNSYAANNLATDVVVYWVDEADPIGSTEVVLGQESLELKKLGAIATLTSELLADEEIDLFGFIAQRVAQGFSKAEDEAFFIGDGSSTYGSFTGLLEIGGTNPVTIADRSGDGGDDGTDFSHMNADDLIAMMDASPQQVSKNGKFYMHRSIFSVVRRLKDENGQPIYQPISAAGPATIWGRPVVEVEAMPSITDTDAATPFVIYGDLRLAAILGFKGNIAVKRFDSGLVRNVADNADINLITTDREAVRWTERVGYIALMPSAVTVLSTQSGS